MCCLLRSADWVDVRAITRRRAWCYGTGSLAWYSVPTAAAVMSFVRADAALSEPRSDDAGVL